MSYLKDRPQITVQTLRRLTEMKLRPSDLEQGEVVFLDGNSKVVTWDALDRCFAETGQTVEEYGLHNLTDREAERVGLSIAEVEKARQLHFGGEEEVTLEAVQTAVAAQERQLSLVF